MKEIKCLSLLKKQENGELIGQILCSLAQSFEQCSRLELSWTSIPGHWLIEECGRTPADSPVRQFCSIANVYGHLHWNLNEARS